MRLSPDERAGAAFSPNLVKLWGMVPRDSTRDTSSVRQEPYVEVFVVTKPVR